MNECISRRIIIAIVLLKYKREINIILNTNIVLIY